MTTAMSVEGMNQVNNTAVIAVIRNTAVLQCLEMM